MPQYYAVLDTNVLVSAMLKEHSVPGTILRLCAKGLLVPVYGEKMIQEYSEVLARSKFHFPQSTISKITAAILQNGLKIKHVSQPWSLPDASDAVFFEVVMEHRKTEEQSYLVTGNLRHFPIKPFVVKPREMLLIVANDLLREHWLHHFLRRIEQRSP